MEEREGDRVEGRRGNRKGEEGELPETKNRMGELKVVISVKDTKDFRSNNVLGYWCQVIGRSWESMQIRGKVADKC